MNNQEWVHDFEWEINEQQLPTYGKCKKCGAEKRWNDREHRWSASMLNGIPVRFCSRKSERKNV